MIMIKNNDRRKYQNKLRNFKSVFWIRDELRSCKLHYLKSFLLGQIKGSRRMQKGKVVHDLIGRLRSFKEDQAT